jgi:AcrR family transcriptional regulator
MFKSRYREQMPRETLTRERIIAAAVELLDREGLEGLNMRALGKQLGSAATAMYWHVGSKANLIVLAADQVWSEIALPDHAELGWRAAASRMASELHSMVSRHPWLLQAFGSYVLYGPGKARYDDHSLAIYEDAGFRSQDADRAATTVFTFVLGNALGPAAAAALGRTLEREGENAEEMVRERMAAAREIAAQFPRLRSRLNTAAADYSAGPEQAFEFGLQAIFDGLERQLGSVPPSADGAKLHPSGGGRARRARVSPKS